MPSDLRILTYSDRRISTDSGSLDLYNYANVTICRTITRGTPSLPISSPTFCWLTKRSSLRRSRRFLMRPHEIFRAESSLLPQLPLGARDHDPHLKKSTDVNILRLMASTDVVLKLGIHLLGSRLPFSRVRVQVNS